jgi:hypothetical protein
MPSTQTQSPKRPRRHTSLLLAITAASLLFAIGAATASASTSITQVWAFAGGEIAIKPEGTTGKYEGIVVKATTFAACVHPVEQQIWKEITLQSDGSYWGLHQWYFNDGNCTENPQRGLTAFRVFEDTSGAYLRVCLSEPGKPQPTIPPGSGGSGSYEGGENGCFSSKLISPLPIAEGKGTENSSPGSGSTTTGKSGTASYIESLSLPSAKMCYSTRLFKIHLKDPAHDPFKTVVVTIKGHKIKTSRHGLYIDATVNLKGLPPGAFTIKIKATTVLGNHLSGKRTYHTCAKKPKVSHPKKLS